MLTSVAFSIVINEL